MIFQTAADDMNMSASLKQGRTGDKGRQWLTASGESLALLSAVLRVIHPEQYALGRSTMEKLAGRADLFDVVKIWSSVFNGLQVISNRECPIHRDNKSRSEWYDLLATIGPYRSAVFEMPGIGIRLAYPTSTVIGLCGRVLRHGVSAADGERICIAQYMRENVQRRVGNINTGWSRWDYYRNLDT
jgi:RNA polymerase subunit RPABC4/transcription elongation factor Spt4